VAAADDARWMARAIASASRAYRRGEVPIGAVVVLDGRHIAGGYNLTISRMDPSAHAEIVALRKAARRHGNHRLEGATLYSTLEPCLMCLGAIVQARIARLVYAAEDEKAGALRLLEDPAITSRLNHTFDVKGGVRAEESSAMLRRFFTARRSAARRTD